MGLTVLARTAVPGVQVEPHLRDHLFRGKDLGVEVLAVPPETRTHANTCLVDLGTSIHCIAADQTSQTAARDAIGSLGSALEPLVFNQRHQFLLEEVQVEVALASEFVFRVVGVGVLVVSIWSVPDPNHNDLPHAPCSHELGQSVLHVPGCPEGGLAVVEEVLAVVH